MIVLLSARLVFLTISTILACIMLTNMESSNLILALKTAYGDPSHLGVGLNQKHCEASNDNISLATPPLHLQIPNGRREAQKWLTGPGKGAIQGFLGLSTIIILLSVYCYICFRHCINLQMAMPIISCFETC